MQIAWIGTGVMGLSMAGRLMDAGHQIFVYSRTQSKTRPLLERGAIWCDSPGQAAEQAEYVFTMVGFPQDVREVYWGERGILRSLQVGTVAIDMTTTAPSLAVEIDETTRKLNAFSLDAPVSGGDIGARNGTLSIMVGGVREVFARALPLLELMGKNIVYQGNAGAGQHTKMCNQIVIAGNMIGTCESLLYASKAGLDLETMLKSIRSGAAASWSLDNLAPRILAGNFDPGFYVEHFVKDMGLALEEANHMGLALPGLSLVKQLYEAVKAQGHGKKGTQALILALRHLNGMA